MKNCYIASCVFTAQFPELSLKIQDYIQKRWAFEIVRCCVPQYKVRNMRKKCRKVIFGIFWQLYLIRDILKLVMTFTHYVITATTSLRRYIRGLWSIHYRNCLIGIVIFCFLIILEWRLQFRITGAPENTEKNRILCAACCVGQNEYTMDRSSTEA